MVQVGLACHRAKSWVHYPVHHLPLSCLAVVKRPTDERDTWIVTVYTEPKSRRQGLARSLVVDAVASTPSNGSVWACAPPGAIATQSLLQATGFKHTLDVMAWPGYGFLGVTIRAFAPQKFS